MDYHLAIFITVMLARRLVWTIVSEVNTQTFIHPPNQLQSTYHCGNQTLLRAELVPQYLCKLWVNSIICLPKVSQSSGGSLLRYVVLIAARLSLLTMCGWVLCWTLVNLCKNHSVLNLLFLGYPWVFLNHQPPPSKGQDVLIQAVSTGPNWRDKRPEV